MDEEKPTNEQETMVQQWVDRAYEQYSHQPSDLEPLLNELDQADDITPAMFDAIEQQLSDKIIKQNTLLSTMRQIRAGRDRQG